MRAIWFLPLLALAACGKDDGPLPPTPPPPTSVNFGQDIDAHGSDPAWNLKIRSGTQITLVRASQPDIAVVAPGAVISPAKASWTAPMADGRLLKVALYASPCTDFVSGQTYAFSAEVDLPGEGPLGGCAGRPLATPHRPNQ